MLILAMLGWNSSTTGMPPIVSIAITFLVCLMMLLSDAPERICPRCGEESLLRRAVIPFGYHYYECESCGVRIKRIRFLDWKDASKPSNERRFRQQSRGKSSAVSVDPTGTCYEGSLTGTQGELLAHKRQRHRPDDQQFVCDQPPPQDP
jgi:hypothetical protein